MKVLAHIFFALMALGLCSQGHATSRIIVRNNSDLHLSVEVVQTGALMQERKQWWPLNKVIGPGEKLSVLEFNRDIGVKKGKEYKFNTIVKVQELKGAQINLFQFMRGSAINSHMWHSYYLKGDGLQCRQNYLNDRRPHSCYVTVGGRKLYMKMEASFVPGSEDNVEYTIYSPEKLPDATSPKKINILAMNTFMRPSSLFKNSQWKRARMLPYLIPNNDVVIMEELFDNTIRSFIIRWFKNSYPYHSKIVGHDKIIAQDGGVMIFSKWPIKEMKRRESTETFKNACRGSDCWSDKGVVYAQINKQGTNYHIFGTHTQAARDDGEDVSPRRKQFKIINKFIKELKIPSNEAVLIGGDMNVDMHHNYEEYLSMLALLDAKHPPMMGPLFSYDTKSNLLAKEFMGGNDQELLDYILYGAKNLAPLSAYNEVFPLKSYFPWGTKGERELSDHFPVFGHFEF